MQDTLQSRSTLDERRHSRSTLGDFSEKTSHVASGEQSHQSQLKPLAEAQFPLPQGEGYGEGVKNIGVTSL